jgi:hypothetical protein
MRRAGSVSSSFSPSSCREIFSIHGNITLRKDPSGIVASFKVMTEGWGWERALCCVLAWSDDSYGHFIFLCRDPRTLEWS